LRWRARDAFQALFDLMIQKLFRRRQKIDRDQAIGQAADHLVAVAAMGVRSMKS